MELIKYIEDNQEKDIYLPQNFHNLFKHFNDKQIITLSNNNEVEWLESFYGKEVNIFELQKVLDVINDIGYYDFKLFKSIIEHEKPESLNEIIRSINSKDNYILISEFEVFYDDAKLSKNIYYHLDKSKLPHQENIDWKEYGKTIRSKFVQQQTKYGWLFELEPKDLIHNPNEIHQVTYPYEKYEFKVELENNRKYTLLQFPMSEEKLLNELVILDLDDDTDFKFIENTKSDYNDFYKSIKTTLETSNLIDVNTFTTKMSGLSLYELRTLISALEVINTNDVSEISYLIDSLNHFELIEEELYSPNDYIKDKLQNLFIENPDKFYDILDKHFDYENYYKEITSKESIVKTSEGILKMNEDFEHFNNDINLEQEM